MSQGGLSAGESWGLWMPPRYLAAVHLWGGLFVTVLGIVQTRTAPREDAWLGAASFGVAGG